MDYHKIGKYLIIRIMEIFIDTEFSYKENEHYTESTTTETFTYKDVEYIFKINFTMFRKEIVIDSIEATITDKIISEIFATRNLSINDNFNNYKLIEFKYDDYTISALNSKIKELIDDLIDDMVDYEKNEKHRMELVKEKLQKICTM